MTDNFDLKKFLKENKALENLNPVLAKENISENDIRSKIREMVIAELSGDDYSDDIKEAKKKKDEEVEDVEVTDTETEEMPAEEAPAEEAPVDGGGLGDVTADMEGDESEIMKHLTDALKVAKGMNNEKLTTQIGNTLKFFVSEYVGGGE